MRFIRYNKRRRSLLSINRQWKSIIILVIIVLFLSFVSETGKVDPTPHTSSFNMGYLVSPYPYPNGAGGPIPVSMVSRRVRLCFSLLLFPSNLACRGLATTALLRPPFCSRATTRRVRTASFVSEEPPDLTWSRTVPRAGSWSRYWFMASANWIHDLYLQPRARARSVSLFREFTINREDHVVFSTTASEKIYKIVDER